MNMIEYKTYCIYITVCAQIIRGLKFRGWRILIHSFILQMHVVTKFILHIYAIFVI